MTIGAIIQARAGSERFPNKVLKTVCGKPLLLFSVERLWYSEYLTPDSVVVATTEEKEDDEIVQLCQERGIPVHRGSTRDLLDRYHTAARRFGFDPVIRVTSDCPLLDPRVADRVIAQYLQGGYDFVSTNHPPTFPDGLDTEIISFNTLEESWKEATQPHEREHVSPFLWDQPSRFRIGNLENDEDLSITERWTVDYPEDLTLVRIVLEHLYREGEVFHMEDVIGFLDENPGLRNINSRYLGTAYYADHWDKIRTQDQLSSYSLNQPGRER